MKKFLTTVIALSLFATATLSAAQTRPTPELLKHREKFADTALFEAKSIYTDPAANAELVRQYRANPESFKNSELFPVAICMLTMREPKPALSVLEKMRNADPKNIVVLRTLASVHFVLRDFDSAIAAYKKASDLGDDASTVFCASTMLIAKKPEQVATFLPKLEKLATSNLEALNIVCAYSIEFKTPQNDAMLKRVLESLDSRKTLKTATPEGMRFVLRSYLASANLWPDTALAIPARAAALFEQWPIALECYKKILAKEPKNTLALRGMGLVNYRLGDITAAANTIKQAYDCGDKDAATDGVELFLLSKYRFVWDMFKPYVSVSKLSLDIRAGLLEYATTQSDCAEMFYQSLEGDHSEILYKDSKVRPLIRTGLDKYSSDPRAKTVASKYYKASNK